MKTGSVNDQHQQHHQQHQHHQHQQQHQPTNKWLENSFSLSDWTTEESIDQDSLKKDNKLVKQLTTTQI